MNFEYTVNLKMFQDDATGEWGLAPSNSLNQDDSFNAFWSAEGLFHDVFEHYFEDEHIFFRGKNAFNVGGEVAAMGHRVYYYETFGFENLIGNTYQGFDWAVVRTTSGMMEEAVIYGYHSFGSRLECGVPSRYSKLQCGYRLDTAISEHCYLKDQWIPGGEYKKEGRAYLNSITDSKLERLYKWGYTEAELIASGTPENKATLSEFFDYWTKFCVRNTAESLKDTLSRLRFTVKNIDGILFWDAVFILMDNTEVKHVNVRVMEDLYELVEDDY